MVEVVVEIPVDGEMTIDVKGVQGASCQKLTEEIEKELGSVKKRTKKPEYYQAAKQTTKTSQKQ